MSTSAPSSHPELILGSAPVTPERVVQLLKEKVTCDAVKQFLTAKNPSYDKHPCDKDEGWKEVIFRTLEEAAQEAAAAGKSTGPSGRAVFTRLGEKEFVLDFVWLEEFDADRRFRRALLGAEVEWWKYPKEGRDFGREELLRNFGKLLCFKAPLKMLAYYCPIERRDDIRNDLRSSIRKFAQHFKGECYLIVEFHKPMRNGHYEQEARIWAPDEDGCAKEVTWQRLLISG